MAEGKKSFVAYSDWGEVFESLPDETAGKLIKHIFNYVNDENPTSDDPLVKTAFIPIRQALKRDLAHWEKVRQTRSESGRQGGRPKKQTKAKKANGSSEKQTKAKKAVNDSVNVNGNVSDNASVNDSPLIKDQTQYKKMSEVSPSDVPEDELTYFQIAKAMYDAIERNIANAGGSVQRVQTAIYGNWVKPIRLMMTKDKVSRLEINKAALFAFSDPFWRSNILSTQKFREKFNKLLLQANEQKTGRHKEGIDKRYSEDWRRNLEDKLRGSITAGDA